MCESGRCIDALKKRMRVLKKRRQVFKKRGRILEKRGRVLKKVRLISAGDRRWATSSEGGGGWLLKKRGGRVLKNPVEVLKEFDPLPSTLFERTPKVPKTQGYQNQSVSSALSGPFLPAFFPHSSPLFPPSSRFPPLLGLALPSGVC